jgi:hypothetical protein
VYISLKFKKTDEISHRREHADIPLIPNPLNIDKENPTKATT